MNRTELISAMAEKSGLSKKDTEAALKAFIEITGGVMKNKDSLQLVGFGTFCTVEKAGREGVNPITKKPMTISPSVQPKFKPGKALKAAVNE